MLATAAIACRRMSCCVFVSVTGFRRHGTQAQLERLPQALARLLSGGPISRDHDVRARLLPHPQPRYRQPRAAPVRRRADRRACREREPDQGLRGRQGRVRPNRGRRAQVSAAREQPHHRHRALRAARRDRRVLSRHALLSGADRPRRRGGFRRDPRCHARREDGGPGARRAVPPRAHPHAGAARQGHRRHQPALCQRGACRGGLFRRDPGCRAAQADAGACQAHHREDDGQVRAGGVRRPLRECADRADPLQAEGHADQAAADAPADQRDQFDGRAEAQRRRRQEPRRRRPSAAKKTAAQSRTARAKGKARKAG